MEKKVSNKSIIFFTISMLTLIVLIGTILKLYKIHDEKMIYVMESNIKYEAKKCFLEEKCNNNKTTLKELYDLKYLEEVVNPITKELVNSSTELIFENDNIIIYYN